MGRAVSDPVEPRNLIIPDHGEPPIDDPMLGLDPWTAGYIRMRKFVQSGDHSKDDIEDLAMTIRATLPFPDPPPKIALAIQADLTLLELMNASDTPLAPQNKNMVAWVDQLWTPETGEE
jgi:hypothetical protein